MSDGVPLTVEGVSKRFGDVRAVDDLSFTVAPGRVTGFLGPNGAGKTTMMRILLGLVRPDTGTATVGAVPYAQLTRPLRVVGAALEGGGFHPGRTARHHLAIVAREAGMPTSGVDALLDRVGLTDAADRRVGGFSHGMRQRLGLATALVGDPGVVLLDEPANGLDPAGIAWLRQFLRWMAGDGRTVLVSSHQLAEVAQGADDVVIIDHGRLVRQQPLADLLASSGPRVQVGSPDTDRLAAELVSRGATATVVGPAELRVEGATAAEVGEAAARIGAVLHRLVDDHSGLEQAFLDLVGPDSAMSEPRPEGPS
ncbi:MAG TPA: ATP-binding cassette domain-containing protein [Actinomycetes bacterium]|nr:ATP-binding cassette domain-containing protein [Actinomycetes bacterium]